MNIAIIAAGGKGRRMNAQLPKQFLEYGGRPIIITCMLAFERHAAIDGIIAVCMPEYSAWLRTKAREYGIGKLLDIVRSGATRRESVRNGLDAVTDPDAVVLIHDAARPLVTERIISDNISSARAHGAAVTAVPARDTIFGSADGVMMSGVLKRSELYHAQTPQSFRLPIIKTAHEHASADATDDAQLALAAGYTVAIVPGDERNFKVTTPEDLERLNLFQVNIHQK